MTDRRNSSRNFSLYLDKNMYLSPSADDVESEGLLPARPSGPPYRPPQRGPLLGKIRGRKATRHLRSLMPVMLLTAYSLFGGYVFYIIEGSDFSEVRREKLLTIDRSKNRSFHQLIVACGQRFNDTIVEESRVYGILDNFAEALGLPAKPYLDITFLGSIFYVGTIYTTIGYGEIVPVTHTGRVFTMLYALAGIPLVLYTISELGRITSLLIGKAYVQLNTRLFARCSNKTVDDASGFPMVIAFMIAFGWMHLCAGIFCFWEDWDYFTALYFFFQSMTTIGLGDVTPRHPAYMVYALFLVIIGLVLASMVWNLIQMKLDHIVRTTVDRIRQTVLELATEEEEEYGNIRNSIYSVQGLEQAVDQQIPDWFPLLLGEKRRQTLCAEYEQRLRCINRRVQTTPIAEESEGTQTDRPDRLDAQTQTDCENRPVLQLPYMEVMRVGGGGASDEFHTLVQQINYLLSDCRSIVTSDHNT